eukprot:scaffold261_cov170-Amphora_coffeaeformis.AAC.11
MTSPRIISLEEIEKITAKPAFHEKLVQGISDGFVQYYESGFFAPAIQTLGAPPLAPFVDDCDDYAAQTCVKSGYFKNNLYYVIKVASGGHPMPNSGNMQLYSQKDGRLLAIHLDEGILTELRTAAIGALALRLWIARAESKEIAKIGMVGTGVQARYQLDAIQHETKCRNLVVYGRTRSNVEAYQKYMQAKGWTVEVADNPNALLENCDVVITTTAARTPVLTADTPGKTRLLICIGSDAPGKSEIADSLLKKATLCMADTSTQSRQRGEFQGFSDDANIVDLGAWIKGPENDTPLQGLMVFDSSGVALQDCVIAQMVYESL